MKELTVGEIKEILLKIDIQHWNYFLGNSHAPSPMTMIVNSVPVPPLCLRPTVKISDDKRNEDSSTLILFQMLKQKMSIGNPNIFKIKYLNKYNSCVFSKK